MPQELLTPKQLAERLGLAPHTVLRMAQLGKIPRVVISKRTIRFDWAAVLEVLRERSPTGVSALIEGGAG